MNMGCNVSKYVGVENKIQPAKLIKRECLYLINMVDWYRPTVQVQDKTALV